MFSTWMPSADMVNPLASRSNGGLTLTDQPVARIIPEWRNSASTVSRNWRGRWSLRRTRPRPAQVAAAEELLHKLDPAKAYPFEFVVYRITGYRPKTRSGDLLTGIALQHDLGLLIEQVSDTLDVRTQGVAEPVLDDR